MENLKGINQTGQNIKSKKENNLQADIVEWFNNNYCLKHHKNRGLIFSIPNGGTRNKGEAMTLKATGLLAGASDLVVILASGIWFVELKNEVGIQSEKQKEFENRITELGQKYIIIKSLNEFQSWLTNM